MHYGIALGWFHQNGQAIHDWFFVSFFCGFPSSRMWTRNSRQKHRNYWPIINSLQPRNYLYPLDARAEKQQLCCYHDTWRYSKTPYILGENVTPLTLYEVINKGLITKVSIKQVVSKGSNFQVEWTSTHQCTMQNGWCVDREHFFIVFLSHW